MPFSFSLKDRIGGGWRAAEHARGLTAAAEARWKLRAVEVLALRRERRKRREADANLRHLYFHGCPMARCLYALLVGGYFISQSGDYQSAFSNPACIHFAVSVRADNARPRAFGEVRGDTAEKRLGHPRIGEGDVVELEKAGHDDCFANSRHQTAYWTDNHAVGTAIGEITIRNDNHLERWRLHLDCINL